MLSFEIVWDYKSHEMVEKRRDNYLEALPLTLYSTLEFFIGNEKWFWWGTSTADLLLSERVTRFTQFRKYYVMSE